MPDEAPKLIHPALLQLIPQFSGDFTEPTTFQDFDNKFRQASHLGGWTHEQSNSVLKLKLKGPALSLVKHDPSCKAETATTADYLAALKKRFASVLHPTQALQTLAVGVEQKPEESVVGFAARVRELAVKSIPQDQEAAPYEQIAMHVFLRHLKPQLRALTLASQPKSFDQAIQAAVQAELDSKLYGLNPTAEEVKPDSIAQLSAQKICRYCKKVGHTIQFCRKRNFKNQQAQLSWDQYSSNTPAMYNQGPQNFQQQNFQNFPPQNGNYRPRTQFFNYGNRYATPPFQRPPNYQPARPFQHNFYGQQPRSRPTFNTRFQNRGRNSFQPSYGSPNFGQGQPRFQNGFHSSPSNQQGRDSNPTHSNDNYVRYVEDNPLQHVEQPCFPFSKNGETGTGQN